MSNPEEPLFKDALFRNRRKKGAYRLVAAPTPPLEAPVADTHAHLDMLKDVPLVLARCALNKLDFICSIVDPHEDEGRAYQFADRWRQEAESILPEIIQGTQEVLGSEGAPFDFEVSSPRIPHIRVACGCHPHNAKYYDEALETILLERLHDPRTCAVGEVGLDYHYDFSPREQQREVFRRQIQIAHSSGLPLILHLREAHEDALKIMDEEGFPQAGVLLHCFNLDYETLKPWLERDCFAAFGGPLTFKKSDETREAAAKVTLSRLLTETDAPYMTPEPMRGMVCGPEHAIFTAEKLAEVYGCEPGEERRAFLEAIHRNAQGLLDREPTAWQVDSGESERQIPFANRDNETR